MLNTGNYIIIFLILAGVFFYSDPAYSKIYKCKDNEGIIAFQQEPCPQDNELLKVERYIEQSARADALHSNTPTISTIKPDCKSQRQKCLCGSKTYYSRYTRKLQINIFMRNLIKSWDKYNALHSKLRTYTNLTSDKYKETHSSLGIMACEILVFQKKVADRHEYSKNQFIRRITIIENRANRSLKEGNLSAKNTPFYLNRYKEIEEFISLSEKIGIKVDYKH